MAHKFCCSRRHLNRLFHQHFGCSVASLRMEMRLLKALSLLRDQALKIINVAEECGFNHLGLFNACFKKRFGSTPSQWRKGAANGEKGGAALNVRHPACCLHTNGLCPLAPKPDNPVATARKADPAALLSRPSGLDDLNLREAMLRNIREVRGQMKCKSRPGMALQSSP
jgi:AraC-like DNA-binding protein